MRVHHVDHPIMDEAAHAVGDDDNAEGFEQCGEALCVGRCGNPPVRRHRAKTLAIALERFAVVVLQIEADAEKVERRALDLAAAEFRHAREIIAENPANGWAYR